MRCSYIWYFSCRISRCRVDGSSCDDDETSRIVSLDCKKSSTTTTSGGVQPAKRPPNYDPSRDVHKSTRPTDLDYLNDRRTPLKLQMKNCWVAQGRRCRPFSAAYSPAAGKAAASSGRSPSFKVTCPVYDTAACWDGNARSVKIDRVSTPLDLQSVATAPSFQEVCFGNDDVEPFYCNCIDCDHGRRRHLNVCCDRCHLVVRRNSCCLHNYCHKNSSNNNNDRGSLRLRSGFDRCRRPIWSSLVSVLDKGDHGKILSGNKLRSSMETCRTSNHDPIDICQESDDNMKNHRLKVSSDSLRNQTGTW